MAEADPNQGVKLPNPEPTMDRIAEMNSLNAWLVIALILLGIAYIPTGITIPFLVVPSLFIDLFKDGAIISKLWDFWLMIGAILGNLQVFACLFSLEKPHRILQNPTAKLIATLGQLSWVYPMGYLYYGWYFWVIGTAVLFTITPNRRFNAGVQ